jgi:hypothetical protein
VETFAHQVIPQFFSRSTNGAGYSPITEETIGGAISRSVCYCAVKSGGTASPAPSGNAGVNRHPTGTPFGDCA